jgi:hypothetical protein
MKHHIPRWKTSQAILHDILKHSAASKFIFSMGREWNARVDERARPQTGGHGEYRTAVHMDSPGHTEKYSFKRQAQLRAAMVP